VERSVRSRFSEGVWLLLIAAAAFACSPASPAPDTAVSEDASPIDGSVPPDATASTTDSGFAADASPAPDAMSADGGSPLDAAIQDTGAPDAGAHDAGGPWVEIGQGQMQFTPVADGDKLVFNLGPQGGGRFGGYNVWGAVRANGLMPLGITLSFSLTGTSGDVLGSVMFDTGLMPDGANESEAGIAILLNDCCKAAGRVMTYHLDAKDTAGLMRSDERHVRGADQCPRDPRNPSVDPCQ
jgi:hypothetical protein